MLAVLRVRCLDHGIELSKYTPKMETKAGISYVTKVDHNDTARHAGCELEFVVNLGFVYDCSFIDCQFQAKTAEEIGDHIRERQAAGDLTHFTERQRYAAGLPPLKEDRKE